MVLEWTPEVTDLCEAHISLRCQTSLCGSTSSGVLFKTRNRFIGFSGHLSSLYDDIPADFAHVPGGNV